MAKNCCVVPGAREAWAGVIAIETSAGATLKFEDPFTAPNVAEIVQAPLAFAVTIPPGATVAMAVFEELHLTDEVTSWLGPLE